MTDYRHETTGEYLFDVPEGVPIPSGYKPLTFVRGGTIGDVIVCLKAGYEVKHGIDVKRGRLPSSRSLPKVGIDPATHKFDPVKAGMKFENTDGHVSWRARDGTLTDGTGRQVIRNQFDHARLRAQGWERD